MKRQKTTTLNPASTSSATCSEAALRLRIAILARETLGLAYQPFQRRAVATDRGLDVVRHECVDVTVENAIEKILAGLLAEILSGTGAQGKHGRNGARPGAAQERQGSPEVEALPQLVPGVGLHDLGAVIEDTVEEGFPGSGELVGELPRFAARKNVALMPLSEVGTPSLDEVPGETVAETCAVRARDLGQALEFRREQAEKPVERGVIAAVRSRREQDEVPRCGAGQTLKQLAPLMPALAGGGARVGLVNDHEVGTRLQEVVSSLAGLHVVEADDRVRVLREDACPRRKAPLQAPRAPGGDGCGADMEANLQLGDPLVHEVRGAEDDGAIDVAAVEKLARDEQGLNRLAHPDVVGDEQAHGVELERHQQRHELVGARLDRDLSKAPKRSGAPS